MPPSGILQTEMDEEQLLEVELQQELDRINLDNDDFAINDDAELNNNINLMPDFDEEGGGDGPNVDGEAAIPAEMQQYLLNMQQQRERFEQELEECDSLMNSAMATARGEANEGETSVVLYDDWKELEEAAALAGLSAEDYRKKLLQDIEDEPFTLEEMDFITDDSEFVLPETNIEEVLASLSNTSANTDPKSACGEQEPTAEDEMIEKALMLARNLGTTQQDGTSDTHLAIADNSFNADEKDVSANALRDTWSTLEDVNEQSLVSVGAEEDGIAHQDLDKQHVHVDRPEYQAERTVAVMRPNPLLELASFLQQQFKLVQERLRERESRLQQELEQRRITEEKLMLAFEEQKLQTMQAFQKEEEELAHIKEESQKKMNKEIDIRQKELHRDLEHQEAVIARLTAQLEEDRYQLEKIERAEKERISQRNDKAAIKIQKSYRGYRERKVHTVEREELKNRKDQRRLEKEQQRIDHFEQEIQQRKEEEKRKDEDAKRAKEEEERRVREEKEEAERKKREEKEKKEEAKRLKKEEAERKKKEEKERKEEEKRLKKEEAERKKREEEEVKKKKEEEARRKKEEEERRKKEEEEKKKEDEENKKKEEEEKKRQKEEERKKKEGEERNQAIEAEKQVKEEDERKQQEKEENKKQAEQSHRPHTNVVKDAGTLENKEMKPLEEQNSLISVKNESNVPQKEVPVTSPMEFTLEAADAKNLPQALENRRLAWIKSCLPWSKLSNEPWKMKAGSEGKLPRRPSSAKKLPPLPDSTVLEAAKVASLRQVTTVELCDLPGHSLSTLSVCVSLKHIKLTRCGLITLDSLSHCKHLQCLDVQDNLIEFMDLKELSSLCMLNLSHNKLSTIHGLSGCTNLRWLDVSHNRLTKLAGLMPLRRLHTLLVNSNQLVTSAGVNQCPTIQHLDLSCNYLTTVEGLDKLAILLYLNVASNNLTQFPSLDNNVLLQELVLRENSIGPDLDLSLAWLPLLFHLDLSQNMIEEVAGTASGLISLKRLDLAVNQISDVSSFLPALAHCPRLEDLSLLGNAVLDEDNLRETVKTSMPCLMCLNGASLRSQASVASVVHPVRSFDILCLTQLQLHKDVRQHWEKTLRCAVTHFKNDGTHVCDDCFSYCDKSFKLAVEHRYAHEYGEMAATSIPMAPVTPRSSQPVRSPRVASVEKESIAVSSSQAILKSVAESKDDPMQSPKVADNIVKRGSKDNTSNCSLAGSFDKLHTAGHPTAAFHHQPSPPHQPHQPHKARKEKMTPRREKAHSPELSAKEKFQMALRGDVPAPSASQRKSVGARDADIEPKHYFTHSVEMDSRQSDPKVDADVPRHTSQQKVEQQKPQLSEKEKFERVLAGIPPELTDEELAAGDLQVAQKRGVTGITADVVLKKETAFAASKEPLPDKAMEEDFDLDDLDNLEEMMEGLQFDIDGFLDLDQFDFDEDFLEKGWRPEDTPQLPPKIFSHSVGGGSNSKPPLPPVASHHTNAPPPGRPGHAWRNIDNPLSDVHAKVPPLRPPSSIASGEDSQAQTTGRSKREERLAEEWGLKDGHTAELMMQRAKKMKYNSERRKKLSKLDPQQRLRLFRKLEEVKGMKTMHPTPPRVLPRKEYFQAREQEAQQKELDKHNEHRARAGRTFEWLHTQVGDYEVSSSRINARPAAGAFYSESPTLKTVTSDTSLSHYQHQHSPQLQNHGPMSLEMESASYMSGQNPVRPMKRHSVGCDDLGVTGSMLPPIKTSGSASSTHSREREKMSWRTEPVNQSSGWGGGKKRSSKK